MKQFSTFLLLLLLVLNTNAKNTPNRLIDIVPKDSLEFMFYLNTQQLNEDSSLFDILDVLPVSVQKFVVNSEEVCCFSQNFNVYTCITVNFKKKITPDSIKSMKPFNELWSEVESTSENFITLIGEKRLDYVYIGKDYNTFKIFIKTNFLNKSYRNQADELIKNIIMPDGDYNEDVRVKLDSLQKLDEPEYDKFLKELIMEEKQQLQETENILAKQTNSNLPKKIYRIFNNKPIAFFVNTNSITRFPDYLARGYSVEFDYYDVKRIYLLSASRYSSEKIWGTIEPSPNGVTINTVSLNKNPRKKLLSKLDKDLLKYLPSEEPDFYTAFNVNLASLKEILTNDFYFPTINDNEKIGYMKLMLLFVDDKLINNMGNGVVSVDKKGGEMHFKAAFKIGSSIKSRLLLNILSKDLNQITKTGINSFALKKPKGYNLVVSDDIWIVGNYPAETLAKELSDADLQKSYPLLCEKNVLQYFKLENKNIKLRKLKLKSAEMTTYRMNRKYMHSKVELRPKDRTFSK